MMDYTAMAEQLSGEYRTIFEKVELYSDMNGVLEEIKADKLMNLLDLLMTAEAEQKPASDIIGSDIKKFCKEYFSDYDMHIKISEIPSKIYEMAWILFISLLLDVFLLDHPTKNLIYMKSDILPIISGIMVGILLAILLKYLIGPVIYRSKRIPSSIYYVLLILLWISFIIISICIIGDRNFQLPSFPFLLASVSYIIIYLIFRSVIRYRKTGTIRKVKPTYSGYEFHLTKLGLDSKDIKDATQKSLVKRFQRINKRRLRRNQTAMTTQEFIDKVRKEDAIVNPVCIWGLGIAYIFMGSAVLLGDICSSGIGGRSFILLAILLAMYIPLFLFIRKCIRLGARYRSEILTNWETQGIAILGKKQKNTSGST